MFYAKSYPPETIREHTDCLLENYNLLKNNYENKYIHMSENLWQLLKIALEYHDIGKAESFFQNKIRKKLKLKLLENCLDYGVYHNILSVILTPYKSLGVKTKDELKLLVHTIGYHHERDLILDRDLKEKVKNIVLQDLLNNKEDLSKHMNLEIISKPAFRPYDLLKKRYQLGISQEEKTQFYKYVMLKGLLHRLDHSSSAHVPIEMGINQNIGERVNLFFTQVLKTNKRDLQSFAEKNQDKHLVIIAQTGMGKTEAGLLWIGDYKGFFTLPLRVSINAMYDRIKDSDGLNFYNNGALGLLHSSSLDYLELKEDDINYEVINNHSRQLANKLLITTIDQILLFPLFYRGFEKELSALAGAKLVIDELQAYDPKITALIVRALEMIDSIGGKFMIMTATMPKIYLDYIVNSKEIQSYPVQNKVFINDDLKRHRIILKGLIITEYIGEMVEAGKNKKVLIICNTVKRAKEVFNELVNKGVPVYILHSLFLQKDRFYLENKIKEFAKGNENGIWITTQLVEASLDIDFDILYTEMSILDSLFQRLGRCYRNRMLDINEPNIVIFTEEVSGVPYVYDKELLTRSINIIKKYDDKILLESKKMELIESLYDPKNLKGTNFLKTFLSTLDFLRNIEPYDINKNEAQRYLRDINNIKAIPRCVYDDIYELIEKYKEEKNIVRKRSLRREIDKYTLSINKYRVKDMISFNELPNSLRDIGVIDLGYNFIEGHGDGLSLKQEFEDFMS